MLFLQPWYIVLQTYPCCTFIKMTVVIFTLANKEFVHPTCNIYIFTIQEKKLTKVIYYNDTSHFMSMHLSTPLHGSY